MRNQTSEVKATKTPLYRKILWGVIIVLFVVTFFLAANDFNFIGIVFGMTSLFSLVFLMLSSKKYYNWTLPFIGFFFVGIFFKMQHWPGSGSLISISALLVFFNLLFFSIKSFFVLRHNLFLKWFSFFTGIALALFMYTFMSKIQHWPLFMPFWLLKHIINLLLILLSLVLIFKLPSLNFSSWPQLDRVVFYRQILLPLVIIFTFSLALLVDDKILGAIFTRGWELSPWGMKDVVLRNLEGLKIILF